MSATGNTSPEAHRLGEAQQREPATNSVRRRLRLLSTQIEPMPRDIAVIVPDVEVVRFFSHRTGHADDLLAIFTAAKS